MSSWGVMGEQLGWGMMMEESAGWRKGPWTAEEDKLLIEYVKLHGEGRWNYVARLAGNLLLLYTLHLSTFNFQSSHPHPLARRRFFFFFLHEG